LGLSVSRGIVAPTAGRSASAAESVRAHLHHPSHFPRRVRRGRARRRVSSATTAPPWLSVLLVEDDDDTARQWRRCWPVGFKVTPCLPVEAVAMLRGPPLRPGGD